MKRQTISLAVEGISLCAVLEIERAPKTCALILRMLPLTAMIKQSRWSGEALWIPLGESRYSLEPENHKHAPFPGELLFYTGAESETEILASYGQTRFSCKAGPLYGNHFATLLAAREELNQFGVVVWNRGAQQVAIDLMLES